MQPTALQWIQLWQVLIVHFSKAYLECNRCTTNPRTLCAAYDCHDRCKLVLPLVCLHWVLRTHFDELLMLLSCYHPISGMRYLFHCVFAFSRADELCPHLPHIRPQMPDRFDRVTFDCLPSLAPLRVLCIAGFGLAAAGHFVSWYLSKQSLAKRRMMLMCRKILRQRHRQCRRMSWGRWSWEVPKPCEQC